MKAVFWCLRIHQALLEITENIADTGQCSLFRVKE